VDYPIVLHVVFVVHFFEQGLEKVAQVLVVRFLVKRKASAVVHVLFELDWASTAEIFDRDFLLPSQHFFSPVINELVLEYLVLVGVWVLGVNIDLCRPFNVPR